MEIFSRSQNLSMCGNLQYIFELNVENSSRNRTKMYLLLIAIFLTNPTATLVFIRLYIYFFYRKPDSRKHLAKLFKH